MNHWKKFNMEENLSKNKIIQKKSTRKNDGLHELICNTSYMLSLVRKTMDHDFHFVLIKMTYGLNVKMKKKMSKDTINMDFIPKRKDKNQLKLR